MIGAFSSKTKQDIGIVKPQWQSSNLEQENEQDAELIASVTEQSKFFRKARHKNIVQLIGVVTKPPHFCIITEFMRGGSVYDYLRQQKTCLRLAVVLRLATDVAKGMDYLHRNGIIHRDLKAANLLMDEYGVVKVCDFGVAKICGASATMTAETGTYRWMAPEVVPFRTL